MILHYLKPYDNLLVEIQGSMKNSNTCSLETMAKDPRTNEEKIYYITYYSGKKPEMRLKQMFYNMKFDYEDNL